jgi:hypothetical protein
MLFMVLKINIKCEIQLNTEINILKLAKIPKKQKHPNISDFKCPLYFSLPKKPGARCPGP